jgi:hypothetical protein
MVNNRPNNRNVLFVPIVCAVVAAAFKTCDANARVSHRFVIDV